MTQDISVTVVYANKELREYEQVAASKSTDTGYLIVKKEGNVTTTHHFPYAAVKRFSTHLVELPDEA